MSHSKRNTSLAFFTSYERGLLKNSWGSQSSRLTRESFLPFGACQLCLLPAQDPVACGGVDHSTTDDSSAHDDAVSKADGKVKKPRQQCHVFCRECIISNLLAQRDELKRLAASQAVERTEAEAAEAAEEAAAAQRAVRDFELTQMGLTSNTATRRDDRREGTVTGFEQARGTKRKFELDEAELVRIAREERDKAKSAIRDEKVRQQ